MTPDQVVDAIKQLGISKVSRITINRWEKDKLIPEAVRGSHGRGIGAFADYPAETPAQFYASWHLLYGSKMARSDVAAMRMAAAAGEDNAWHQLLASGLAFSVKLTEAETSSIVHVAEAMGKKSEIMAMQLAHLKKSKLVGARLEDLTKKVAALVVENTTLNHENKRLKEELHKLKLKK